MDAADAEKLTHAWFQEVVYTMMRHDLDAAIESKSNMLGALGVVCYGETLGALKRGTIGKKHGETAKNFAAFLDALPAPYNAVDQRLRTKWGEDGGVYDKVRCGLVHEYS